MEKSAGKALFEQRERLYRVQKQKLDEYVTAILLTEEAKRRGKSVEALLNDEVNSKIMPVRDDEIEAFYRVNRTNLSSDSPEAREHIRQLLHYKKIEAQTDLEPMEPNLELPTLPHSLSMVGKSPGSSRSKGLKR